MNTNNKIKFIKVLDEIERDPGFYPCSARKGKKKITTIFINSK